jgi:glyoxylase-like metal-dependent hydrolase (beta-lactamase superfamily II)
MGEDLKIHKIAVGQLDVNCYIVSDGTTPDALVIDPGDEYERIRDAIDTHALLPKCIIFTHAHYDHVCAAKELKDTYNTLIIMHPDELSVYEGTKKLCISWGYESEDFPPPDRLLQDDDPVLIGTAAFRVIHTPGHTPGGICLYGKDTLFTGDTLFAGSMGRTDLHGGNREQLLHSLRKIMSLPGQTRVLSGHGDETTVRREMQSNPFMRDL